MIRKFLAAIGEYALFLKTVFRKPEKWKIFWKQLIIESDKLILSSILLVGVISLFIGGVLVIQTASNLENPIIDKMYIGYMVRESLILEFCSTMVALILAGKMGSNIASEIGTMRVTQQIDALDVMGVNSANYILLPKILAMVTAIPLLVTFSIASGFIGAYVVCWAGGFLSLPDLTYGLQHDYAPWHLWSGYVKSFVFAFIIASVSGYFGYTVRGGSIEVGKAGTNSVVVSSVLILFTDLLLTNLLMS